MLFNSAIFLFAFLPLTLIGFHAAGRLGRSAQVGTLLFASVFFYAWWNPPYLLLLSASICLNYALGRKMVESADCRGLMVAGVALNLGLIAYFKYAGFLASNANALFGESFLPLPEILLPLGISFFTFQQIAYLVEIRRGGPAERSFLRYALFVSFFPQLVAGPIVQYRNLGPQLAALGRRSLTAENMSVGLAIFIVGLFKKVVIADNLAAFVGPTFDSGAELDFLQAWGAVLAYTFQIYFDFSGYSDMAIGLGRMFGIVLPLNFASPYKASSIIEFWRRWHITLSRFLAEYLYIPLGGNRRGEPRRFVNLMVTMLLGGLWHGASWTFVLWGGLHGLLLGLNHLLHRLLPHRDTTARRWRWSGWLATFLCVAVAWVFFRADTTGRALDILAAMAGGNGIAVPWALLDRIGSLGDRMAALGVASGSVPPWTFILNYLWIAAAMGIAFFMPNTGQLFAPYGGDDAGWKLVRDRPRARTWRPTRGWALAVALLAALSLLSLSSPTEFLYFNF